MTHILIPTDFSEGSLHAIRFALDAFGTEGTEFILLHSVGDVPRQPLLPEYIDDLKRNGREELREFADKCRALRPTERLNLVSVVDIGSVFAAIERVYKEREVHAVVLGARGKGEAELWGTQTTSVVKNSTRPVIVVPTEWKAGHIAHILYADDRAYVHKQRTLIMLVELAKRHKARITLAHVRVNMDEPLSPSEVAMHAGWFDGVEHTTLVVPGADVTERLMGLAAGGEYDMIAVLHRDLNWFDELFHGSVAKRMALHTTVPLLVLQE